MNSRLKEKKASITELQQQVSLLEADVAKVSCVSGRGMSVVRVTKDNWLCECQLKLCFFLLFFYSVGTQMS